MVEAAPDHAREAAPRRWRALRWLARVMMFGVVAGAAAICAGFGWFVHHVPDEEVAIRGSFDGIVVLTGGASRISDAIELLAAGHGKRLLISGANRSTNQSEIARLNPEFARVVGCCVDFDRSLNTLGNAIETRRWAQSRGFNSL